MAISALVRRGLTASALVGLVFVAGCGDEDDDHDHEPEVETMRVVIGGTTVNFSGATCTPSVATVNIPTTGATVTATFLAADGDLLDIHDDEFELRVEPAARFTRTGAFAGNVSGGTVGAANVSFGLFHLEEQHTDFGPCSVSVVVQ